MAIFPKIQSPCPYKANLAAVMDGDMCRMCKRQVHDITDWTDEQRVSFLADCKDEVCVSYRLPVKIAAAAAVAVASLATPMAAAAQDCPEVVDYLIVGGIRDPGNVEMVDSDADKAMAELPVIYEDAAPVQTADQPATKSATKQGGA